MPEKIDPPIMTFEEMQKLLSKDNKNIKAPAKKKQKGRNPETPKVEATPEVDDSAAYYDIHFWCREVDTWGNLLQDAKAERKLRNANVLVFAHTHVRGQACDHLCREVKAE